MRAAPDQPVNLFLDIEKRLFHGTPSIFRLSAQCKLPDQKVLPCKLFPAVRIEVQTRCGAAVRLANHWNSIQVALATILPMSICFGRPDCSGSAQQKSRRDVARTTARFVRDQSVAAATT